MSERTTIAGNPQFLLPRWLGFLVLGLVATSLFAIRLSGSANLMGNNERRVAAYVLDAVQNGHWICQSDANGSIESKPPLQMWMSALATLVTGRINRFALYFPGALATLLLSWVIFAAGEKHFGRMAGFLGALAYLLCYAAAMQVETARFDALFALPAALGALAAFRAWQLGRGWTWFWLAGAMSTMVKGPLGVLLAAGGLVAVFWEKRSGQPAPVRGNHAMGVLLFLLITAGWFGLACWQVGYPVFKKLLVQELFQQSVSDKGSFPLVWFYYPSLLLLVVFAPWSIAACLGFWRVWKRPSSDPWERRWERFVYCWFFVGLTVFSVSAHQRTRLIYPLVVPAAIIAGRELARWLERYDAKRVLMAACAVIVAFLGVVAACEYAPVGRSATYVAQTHGMQMLAQQIREQVGEQFPLTHVHEPFVLQYYLNGLRFNTSFERAAKLLRGDAAAFVAVDEPDRLQEQFATDEPPFHEVARSTDRKATVRIVSNRPRLEWADPMAYYEGPILVRLEGVRPIRLRSVEIIVAPLRAEAAVTVSNESAEARGMCVRFQASERESKYEKLLAPGEAWRVTAMSTGQGELQK